MVSLRDLLSRLFCPQKEHTVREFESTAELGAFIITDWTNFKLYQAQTHDCDDFAREFQRAALQAGYLVNLQLVNEGRHMLCMAVIQDEMYYIEPQTDAIWKYGPLD